MTTPINIVHSSTVELISCNATDEAVARAAWVSTMGEAAETRDTSAASVSGLINFLMRDRHGTPFEHNSFTFMVKAPIAVFREFHRHRVGFSYNEQSGRYSKLQPEFYIPPAHRPVVQTAGSKPGEYKFEMGSELQYMELYESMKIAFFNEYRIYERLLEAGIAKEVARGVLPVYLMSSMYVTCNARSIMHFLGLRTKHDDATFPSFPMFEIAEVAGYIEFYFSQQMPATHAAFTKHGRVAP